MAARLKPPIFLIGNYRSGTTITQNLIGLHPDIVTWYEPRTLWLYADRHPAVMTSSSRGMQPNMSPSIFGTAF